MKYSDVRIKLADIMMPIIGNDFFAKIYRNNICKVSESDAPILMVALSYETKMFIHDVLNTKTEKLKNLYNKTNPKIIICFYLRYWNVINQLKEYPDKTIDLPEDNECFVKALLFDLAESYTIVN